MDFKTLTQPQGYVLLALYGVFMIAITYVFARWKRYRSIQGFCFFRHLCALRIQAQFPAMEQNGDSIILEVPKPPRVRLNGLDNGIESFGHSIGHMVFEIREESFKVAFQCFCGFNDGFQPRMRRPEVPPSEKLQRRSPIRIHPERLKRFFDGPGFPDFQLIESE